MPIQSLERFCLERSAKFSERLIQEGRVVSITMRVGRVQRTKHIYNYFRSPEHRMERVDATKKRLVDNFPL